MPYGESPSVPGLPHTVLPDPPPATAEQIEESRPIIVAIGASAGGLEAIISLLRELRVHRIGFVIVQHLPPDGGAPLLELLGRATPMPVLPALDETVVRAGNVYCIQPGQELFVVDGVLKTRAAGRPTRPIDVLFRSLAEDQG